MPTINTKISNKYQNFPPSSFVGYSTEIKPTENVGKGSDFLELDGMKDVYIFDGEIWVKL